VIVRSVSTMYGRVTQAFVPGTTTANDPIRDEAIWKIDTSGEIGQVASIAIADEGLKLAIVFADAWASVNPQRPPIGVQTSAAYSSRAAAAKQPSGNRPVA